MFIVEVGEAGFRLESTLWPPWQFTQEGARESPRAAAWPWRDRACCCPWVEWQAAQFTLGTSTAVWGNGMFWWQSVHPTPALPCTEAARSAGVTRSRSGF